MTITILLRGPSAKAERTPAICSILSDSDPNPGVSNTVNPFPEQDYFINTLRVTEFPPDFVCSFDFVILLYKVVLPVPIGPISTIDIFKF